MVAVDMRDEDRSNASNLVPGTAKPGECRRGCVDDVAPVEEGEGMVPPVWEEGVARPQHLDVVSHTVATARCFFFSSVGAVGEGDVKRYQP